MSEHRGNTNERHRVRLDSRVERVMWSRGAAPVGSSVGLHVFTRFVGNGADLQIALKDGRGRGFGNFKYKLSGNQFTARIAVPRDASGALIAEVKLPKHGLSMGSPALLLMPPVEISDLQWSSERLERGQIVTLSATVRGAPDGAEAQLSVFEVSDDGARELLTRIPTIVSNGRIESEWEFTYPESVEDVPTARERETGYENPQYIFRAEVAGVESDSSEILFRDWIEIRLQNREGTPARDARFVVTLANGEEREGRLDDQGFARLEDVPPGPARVAFPDIEEADLQQS